MQRPICPAGAALLAWLREHKKSQAAFARELDVDRSVMWRWLVGEATPHVESAAAIERITGIPASLWARERTKLDPDAPIPLRPTGKDEEG